MQKTLGLLLAVCVAAAALVFGGYQWGSAAHEEEKTRAVAAANVKYQKEVDRGQEASKDFGAKFGAMHDQFSTLTRKFNELSTRRAPLVRARGVPSPAPSTAPAAPPSDAPEADEKGCVLVVPPAEPVITHGALWMWNSALVGRDLPAGACGSADTSEGACDAGTEVTVDDAWDNHTTNAKACAADRLRHQSLIDFLKGRK